jgi:FKBP-type peptidyl-prolyl cis-trans isomerase FkpA
MNTSAHTPVAALKAAQAPAHRQGRQNRALSLGLALGLAGVVVAMAPQGAMAQQPAPAQTVSTLTPPTGAANVTTSTGLIYTSMKDGTGASPQATDTVRVHYRGTFPDGKEFDSSYSRGQPAQFPLNRVIRCWTEGVQMIKVGGKARLVCPPAIAYGERGTPGGPIPPNATLHFEVELLGIVGK